MHLIEILDFLNFPVLSFFHTVSHTFFFGLLFSFWFWELEMITKLGLVYTESKLMELGTMFVILNSSRAFNFYSTIQEPDTLIWKLLLVICQLLLASHLITGL